MIGYEWVGVPRDGVSHAVPASSYAAPEDDAYDLACSWDAATGEYGRFVMTGATIAPERLPWCARCLVVTGGTLQPGGGWRE